MNAKVNIERGEVGAAVNAETGAIIHIHMANSSKVESSPEQAPKGPLSSMLQLCNELNCKPALERISQNLFGTTYFKGLQPEQLLKLYFILNEFAVRAKDSQSEINKLVSDLSIAKQDSAALKEANNSLLLERAQLSAQLTKLTTPPPTNHQIANTTAQPMQSNPKSGNLAHLKGILVLVSIVAIFAMLAATYLGYKSGFSNLTTKTASENS
ncbi:hypothetical protein HZU77_013450 [Neisseriaceae bacterium TC5R-5]|nr:hypothetical protein [Neisseriaceae bacterium TC5R-5]